MKHLNTQWLERVAGILLVLGMLAGCGPEPEISSPAVSAPQQPSELAALYGVNAQVSYAGDVAGLGTSAMVYVFLREPGSRMPLAVQHFPAADLPQSVRFPGLSPQQAVELVVRLSKSGRVDRSPEDLELIRTVNSTHPPETQSMVLAGTDSAGEREPGVAQGSSEPLQASLKEAAPVVIRASVTIEPGHQFPSDTIVFIIARTPGQKMPTVVKRLSVADLPAQVELTDADSMTFSNRLSDSRRLDFFARVSTSGSTSRSSSDWKSETLNLDTKMLPDDVKLLISP